MTTIMIISGIAIAIGLLALYAPEIEKWCEEQLAKEKK